MSTTDLSACSMIELFRIELEGQSVILTEGLLALEKHTPEASAFEPLMRAAHSLKGAARIVGLNVAVRVAHAMEDVFVAAQNSKIVVQNQEIDLLLRGVDLLTRIGHTEPTMMSVWENERAAEIETFLDGLRGQLLAKPADPKALLSTPAAVAPVPAVEAPPVEITLPPAATPAASPTTSAPAAAAPTPKPAANSNEKQDRVLRITAANMNRLLGLVGESLVESRWLPPFAGSLTRLKRLQADIDRSLESLRENLRGHALDDRSLNDLSNAQSRVAECRQFLSDRMHELEQFDRRSANLSQRLYRQVVDCRMRPFTDGTHGFPRMIRELAQTLGKKIKFEIVGETTQVDRDILEKLEAPLTHLLRNAIDHGVETPAEREAAGKPAEATVRLEARHRAGMLQIVVTDDGRGISFDKLRHVIVQKKLTTTEMAARMSEAELIEFLFLPGFSTKEKVTEISGRGVGLDVVQVMVKQLRGTLRAESKPGHGMRFQLQLPLTLSVSRMLIVEIAGEQYALPLAHITRTLKLQPDEIQALEGRQHFRLDGQLISLVTAHQLFALPAPGEPASALSVIVVGDRSARYGVLVDGFLGERELAVQALDPRLGKLRNLNAAALMPDGSPVLVVDVEDLLRSIEILTSDSQPAQVNCATPATSARRQRVLVVDDSLTVREIERKLLQNHGYEVDLAVDGQDGWNTVRVGNYDLVITDVDMPRMDGIELVRTIKSDARLHSLPVMIVSYKDREQDRLRGLEAGADYYLTKGSFHDETLVNAVVDLIGEGKP